MIKALHLIITDNFNKRFGSKVYRLGCMHSDGHQQHLFYLKRIMSFKQNTPYMEFGATVIQVRGFAPKN